MKFSYYPGCSLHSTAAEFSASTEAIFKFLGVKLQELDDWCCCGATSGHSINNFLSHALPLYNLILAENNGSDIVVPCAACYSSLKSAQVFMKSNNSKVTKLNNHLKVTMGRTYQGQINVYHVLEILNNPQIQDLLKKHISKNFNGIPLASYYGCLLNRPPKAVSFEDNPEQPKLMDKLLNQVGATPVVWPHKNECCGASLAISQPKIVEQLVAKIIGSAKHAGAKAIVTACPLCQTNLDSRQPQDTDSLPVFFITEIIGLALGINSLSWLKKHLIDPIPF
ncbi:MAG: heterodisulfide reductase subunit [Clostridia bacterium]|nr:heterodisulfide reductase subunit [Clostridia bacterium]